MAWAQIEADAFCDPPNIFDCINKAIKELSLGEPIDWLPDSSWKAGWQP